MSPPTHTKELTPLNQPRHTCALPRVSFLEQMPHSASTPAAEANRRG